MNRKGVYKIILLLTLLFMIFITGCRNNNYIDPFWGIQLNADKTTILKELNEKSMKGEIKSGIFSFEKILYIKTEKFDARLTGNLNNPVFVDHKLVKMSYALLIDFKNEAEQAFNSSFYNYFIGEMERVYGKPQEQKNSENDIMVDWIISNGSKVIAHVIKDTNTYQVKFQKR